MPDNDPQPEVNADRIRLRLREDLKNIAPAPGLEAPPPVLYHYTTTGGLAGITQESALWASDARFLNDSTELRYASELVSDTLVSYFNENASGPVAEALRRRRGYTSPWEHAGPRPYISCFCEDGDLLSQWRGYGQSSGGFSLGLDIQRPIDRPRFAALLKVEYAPEVQRKLVMDTAGTWLSAVDSIVEDGWATAEELIPGVGILALQEALGDSFLRFKHPSFAEEREWRLVTLVDTGEIARRRDFARSMRLVSDALAASGGQLPPEPTPASEAEPELGFRATSIGLVPYVALPLRGLAGVNAGRLPLVSVTQGPVAHPEVSLQALEEFLRFHGYGFPHCEVKVSTAPLRS